MPKKKTYTIKRDVRESKSREAQRLENIPRDRSRKLPLRSEDVTEETMQGEFDKKLFPQDGRDSFERKTEKKIIRTLSEEEPGGASQASIRGLGVQSSKSKDVLRNPSKGKTKYDKTLDDSFPASDPPGNY